MTKPLKVIILSHSSAFDGAERSMFDLFDYWTRKGLVKVHFVIRQPLGPMIPELEKRGWQYTALQYNGWAQRNAPTRTAADSFRNSLFGARAVEKIQKLIDSYKPDIVMTNTLVTPWAAFAAYTKQIPHVWFVREYGYLDNEHFFQIGREETFQDIGKFSNLVVTNSATLAQYIRAFIPKEKTTHLYNPFRIDELEKKAAEKVKDPFKSKDSLKLVITGRIAPSKGQFEAAEATGILNQEGVDTELCIIGEPAEERDAASLNEIINKYQIGKKVHFLGRQPNPLAYVVCADVGIMASQHEAFGRVTFEYMVAGRAVVGARSGATPEMIEEGKNGYLYKSRDTQSLVRQLRNYAKNRELVKIHGDAGKKKAAQMMKGKHNADALFEQIEKVSNSKQAAFELIHSIKWWLNFPIDADDYIEESKVIAFKRLVYLRLRARAKTVYLWVNKLVSRSENDNR